ncbi:MAG: dockerin type I domain-containing protein [Planctomycetota bacterium]|jgi:hypothetical protein
MKNLATVIILLAFSSIAVGEVSTRVCLADANTPLELADPNIITDPNVFVYRDIMVGTKLTIIIDSNISGEFIVEQGYDLAIQGEYMKYGLLSARDYNDITGNWQGSVLEAASSFACVYEWVEMGIQGFNLQSDIESKPGDWFIIDYVATNIGECTVGFFDRNISWDEPVCELKFSHVLTRDFNQDTKVDVADLALFSLYWLQADCTDPDWCAGTDLNTDGIVDNDDLMLFTDFWLERTE